LGNGQWDIPDLKKLLQKVLSEQKSFSDFEVAIEVPNIGRRSMMLNARVIRKEEVYPTSAATEEKDGGMILLAIEDITERKKAEEALHASLERYRSYIEVTGQLGWTTNADGEVVEDLPSWRIYTGQPYEEIRGQGWSKALHPDDVEHTLQIWKKAVTERSNYEVEYRIRRHDGSYRYFMARGTPVLKEDGSLREWVGTCIDITDRKKAEEEIRRLNVKLKRKVGELEASNEDWEMFSHAVSHELRSPLFLIDGLARVVLTKYANKVAVQGKEELTTIMEAVKQMAQLLDDLFVFSRAGAQEIKADTVNMEEITKHAFDGLKTDTGNRNIQLEMKSLPSCHGDSSLLRQVFVNLFTNAIKFTEPREIASIEVGSMERGDEIVFYIKDNGVVFDMEYKDKLFNIFQRLHSSDDFKGTGAGLAIVRRIIEKHGGKVWAESKLGEGATFYFTLPANECLREPSRRTR
jgi:PAS domain S-box-containing protein